MADGSDPAGVRNSGKAAFGPPPADAETLPSVALLLAFSVILLVGVLISGFAHRSVLSTAVLFLLAGFFLGDGMLGRGGFARRR